MWTWNEIEADWLVMDGPPPEDSRLPDRVILGDSPAEVVRAFEHVEAQFGRAWVEERRQERRFVGILEVLKTAALLGALDGIHNGEKLVEKLRVRDSSAQSEATALLLIRDKHPGVEVEYEPTVSVGRRNASPDFRVRADSASLWTYLEVVGPESSEEQMRLREVGKRLGMARLMSASPIAVELELHRIPTDAEVETLEQRLEDLSSPSADTEELLENGLGRLAVKVGNADVAPSRARTSPSLVVSSVALGDGQVRERSTVTIAYSDPRGDQFLRRKARQLPMDAPGLVMLDVGKTIGASSGWEGLLTARLGRDIHTRVSGVCLFESFTTVSAGWVWGVAASYLPNESAQLEAPDWLVASLRRWPTMPEVMKG